MIHRKIINKHISESLNTHTFANGIYASIGMQLKEKKSKNGQTPFCQGKIPKIYEILPLVNGFASFFISVFVGQIHPEATKLIYRNHSENAKRKWGKATD